MKTTLQFSCMADLWQFKEIIQASNEMILSEEHILIGDFEEAAIELAQRGYGAKVIDVVPNTPSTTNQTD